MSFKSEKAPGFKAEAIDVFETSDLPEADQHGGRVQVAGDAVLELEQRPVLGEEALLPVLAARLVHGLDGVVLPVGLVNIHTPHQDGHIAADNLKHVFHFGTVGSLQK